MNRDTGSREDKLFMGVTPLMIAVLKEKAGAISVLLSEGADLEERDDEGHTALILATLTLKEEIISQLIKAGAKIDAKDHKGKSALNYLTDLTDSVRPEDLSRIQKIFEGQGILS